MGTPATSPGGVDPRILSVATGGVFTDTADTAAREGALTSWARDVAHDAQAEIFHEMGPINHEVIGPIVSRAVEQQCVGLARYLAGDATSLRLSRDNRALIGQMVREDLKIFPGIIRGIRTVEQVWRRSFIHLVVTNFSGDECGDLLEVVDSELSRYFDQQIDSMSAMHSDEVARAYQRQSTTRRQIVERLLGNEDLSPRLVKEKLGVTATDSHLGVVVSARSSATGPRPVIDLVHISGALTAHATSGSLLTVPREDESIWFWVSAPHLDVAAIHTTLDRFALEHTGVVVSAGNPAPGLAGFRSTILQAQAARTSSQLVPRSQGLTAYRDHALLSILTADPEQATWFVDQEIGPLLGDEPTMQDLRATLLRFIERGGNIAETASALFVHRNTVTYRLRRITDILGRDPLERTFETHAALVLDDALEHRRGR
ncbi:hypothetical protein GCM10027416_18490 [Okibacterium endophyticum]